MSVELHPPTSPVVAIPSLLQLGRRAIPQAAVAVSVVWFRRSITRHGLVTVVT